MEVRYGEQCEQLSLVVVAGDGPSLFGRNWLQHIQLDRKSIKAVTNAETNVGSLEQVIRNYGEVFKDELATVHSLQAKLHVHLDAHPKFRKARPIPFAIKDAIEQKLDHLESIGVIHRVTHSEWAASIVPVPKTEDSASVVTSKSASIPL